MKTVRWCVENEWEYTEFPSRIRRVALGSEYVDFALDDLGPLYSPLVRVEHVINEIKGAYRGKGRYDI